jgi:hypothetical protein
MTANVADIFRPRPQIGVFHLFESLRAFGDGIAPGAGRPVTGTDALQRIGY